MLTSLRNLDVVPLHVTCSEMLISIYARTMFLAWNVCIFKYVISCISKFPWSTFVPVGEGGSGGRCSCH